MLRSSRTSVQVIPSGAALGADIEGVDLSQALDDSAVDSIMQAWHEHLVLRFRGQKLTDPQLAAFSHHFGDLDAAPPAEIDSPLCRGTRRSP